MSTKGSADGLEEIVDLLDNESCADDDLLCDKLAVRLSQDLNFSTDLPLPREDDRLSLREDLFKGLSLPRPSNVDRVFLRLERSMAMSKLLLRNRGNVLSSDDKSATISSIVVRFFRRLGSTLLLLGVDTTSIPDATTVVGITLRPRSEYSLLLVIGVILGDAVAAARSDCSPSLVFLYEVTLEVS